MWQLFIRVNGILWVKMSHILHVWDQAGVACTLAKYQKKIGHEVQVIKQERHDELGFLKFYNEMFLDMDGNEFDEFAIDISKNYDIIHCHSVHDVARTIKETYPEKKVFIHYHGSDIRTNPIDTKCHDIVDGIFYATPDLKQLLPDKAKYLPTIIDTELFYPSISGVRGIGTFTNKDIKCQYRFTPHFYSGFDTFIDSKTVNGVQIKAMSKTALECLALGMTVIDWEDRIHKGLPEKHKPENVVRLLDEYYN